MSGEVFATGNRVAQGRPPQSAVTWASFDPMTAFEGLNTCWMARLLGATAVFAFLSARAFEQWDIRVGREQGWRWPRLFSLRRRVH